MQNPHCTERDTCRYRLIEQRFQHANTHKHTSMTEALTNWKWPKSTYTQTVHTVSHFLASTSMTYKHTFWYTHTHTHTSRLRSESGAWPTPPSLLNTIVVWCKCHWVIYITHSLHSSRPEGHVTPANVEIKACNTLRAYIHCAEEQSKTTHTVTPTFGKKTNTMHFKKVYKVWVKLIVLICVVV